MYVNAGHVKRVTDGDYKKPNVTMEAHLPKLVEQKGKQPKKSWKKRRNEELF